jgi:hypothetical protein
MIGKDTSVAELNHWIGQSLNQWVGRMIPTPARFGCRA